MPLKAKLDSLDGLSETEQKLYVQRNGSFVLDVEPVGDFALDDVGGLKRVLNDRKDRQRRAEDALAAFEGLEAGEVREALARLQKLEGESKDPDKGATKAALEAKIRDQETALKDLQGKFDRTHAQLKTQLVDNAILGEISKLGGKAKMLLPALRDRIDMRQVEGSDSWQQVVLDDNGQVRETYRDGKMVPVTSADLLAEMHKDPEWAGAFPASGASGSGARSSSGGGAGSSGPHVISAADAEDHARYVQAREAADKAGVELQIAE